MKKQILLVALLCAGLAGAQTPPNSQRVLTPNIQNNDIAVVAQMVTEATGIIFIPDQAAATRKISFPNRQPMTPQEFYNTFVSILQTQGFAVVPAGRNTMKIVQEANARTLPGSELTPSTGPDEMVHVVIPVKNVNAQQVATVLNQLRSQYGVVMAVPGTNQIILTDRAANVRRMRQIIERVDQTSGGELDVIPLQYATAPDLVRTLTQLIGTQQQANTAAGIAPKITADSRTNSVLILGEPAQRLQLATWVAHLDTPLEQGGGEPGVIYLKYADAEELAPLLKEFATGIAQAEAVAAAGGAAAPGGATAAPVSTTNTALDRSTTILADPGTNALIVMAPPKMMRELSGIIDRLDIPRAQVYLHAIIAEVSTDKAADLGVNWAMFSEDGDARVPAGGFISPVAGASIVDLAGLIADPDSIPDAAAAGAIPNGATFGVGQIRDGGFNFGLILRALRTDGDSNVIAEPQFTATDNEETVFQDGQQVPFLGSFTNSLGTGGQGGPGGGINLNPTTSVNREDIGTKLTITPQINDGGSMTLQIDLESSELTGATGDAGSAITQKRAFKTVVRVDDGQTVVLAGMVRNFERQTESRVPYLGRIPVVGQLFKTRRGERQKRMLMVFIRPMIVTDAAQMGSQTSEKYNLIREEQMRQGDRSEVLPILPGTRTPTLPELQQPPSNPVRPEGVTTRPVP